MIPFGLATSLLMFIYLLIDFNYVCNLFCISYLFLWQLLAQIVVCDITEFGKTVENNIGEVLLHCCICFGSIRVHSQTCRQKY